MSKYTLPLIVLALTACAKNGATNETFSGPASSQTRRTELGVVGFTDTFATGFASQVYLGSMAGYFDFDNDHSVNLAVDQSGDEVYTLVPRSPSCPALHSGLFIGTTGRFRYEADFFGLVSEESIGFDPVTGMYSGTGIGDFFILEDNPAKPVVNITPNAGESPIFDRVQILIQKESGCMTVIKKNWIPN